MLRSNKFVFTQASEPSDSSPRQEWTARMKTKSKTRCATSSAILSVTIEDKQFCLVCLCSLFLSPGFLRRQCSCTCRSVTTGPLPAELAGHLEGGHLPQRGVYLYIV